MRNGDLSPVALKVAFGEVVPVQAAEQVEQAQGGRAGADTGGQEIRALPTGVQIGLFSGDFRAGKGGGQQGKLSYNR